MRALRIIAVVIVVAAIVTWWRWPRDAAIVMRPVAAAATVTPAPVPAAPVPQASMAAIARVAPATPTTKAAGTLSFRTASGPLDMQVSGGVALWNPSEHRLRVLLTGEPLDPPLEQQMLGYLRDERLADSGRQYGILELQFRPDATTLDRSALTSASLTVAAPGGGLQNTADVLSSLQWTGRVQSSGDDAAPRLELAAAGSAEQQQWQLSLAVPVAQVR
jgi:hypothetical protein